MWASLSMEELRLGLSLLLLSVLSTGPWRVLLPGEPARCETELAVRAGGFPYTLPDYMNWNLSKQERRLRLEDVGMRSVIGTEGLKSISRELGLNRIIMIKCARTCDEALPGSSAQGRRGSAQPWWAFAQAKQQPSAAVAQESCEASCRHVQGLTELCCTGMLVASFLSWATAECALFCL